jgi:O-antigen ligase
MSDAKSEKRGLSTFKLSLIVIILLLVPTTMEQLAANPDMVKNVGRVCVGIALLFFFYGLVSKALRFVGLILFVLIVARVLANEGVVEVPKLKEKIEAAREERSELPGRR